MTRPNREDRVCCTSGDKFVMCNLKEDEVKRLLRDELEVYSYQFKQASTVFNKGQVRAWIAHFYSQLPVIYDGSLCFTMCNKDYSL